jgi:uncharacterized PurR-regulated membrane protein YhhQ (DUF165 family)/predicted DNA-binding transcriptional regulator AlpA
VSTNIPTASQSDPSTTETAPTHRATVHRAWPRRRVAHTATAVLVFAATVVAANWLTARYGVIDVGLGLTATAGTFAAGATLLVRDWVHQAAGRAAVYACIAVGAALSIGPAGPRLAAASVVAFVTAELVDLLVFQQLRSRGTLRAALLSNAVAAPIDTTLFLTVAGLPVWPGLPGQLWAKMLVTAVPLAVLAAGRALRRRRSLPAVGTGQPAADAKPAPDAAAPTPWTADAIRELGATTDLATAAAIFGMSIPTAYRHARAGTFPVPVVRVGRSYRIPVAPILAVLHLALTGPDHDGEEHEDRVTP